MTQVAGGFEASGIARSAADGVAPLREALLGGAGFTVAPAPARVLFGAGTLHRLPELVDELGARRVLVVASAGRGALVERVAALLGGRLADVDTRVAMHVPVALAHAVSARAAQLGADLVLAVGGGSAIGMAKAIALGGGPACIAVPTTYAGSEMTPVWGMTRDGEKQTGRDERVRPRAVLYDPTLMLELPPRVSGPSALNAAAHCVEALYAPDVNPVVALLAAEGLRAIAAGAPRVVRVPTDLTARTGTLYGAWLAGLALGACTMGLHHKLCHVLGGSFGMPHAETHAVLLPHTVGYNAGAAPAAMAVAAGALASGMGRAVDTNGVPDALHALVTDVVRAAGAPGSLRDLGMQEADLSRAAELAAARPYPNPRPVLAEPVHALLLRAFEGLPPVSDG
ncbi:MAG TPA: maleylacetate reductase [Gemmatimonadaceae bacterium]|nr:maleylacetate reductase [Gemmatimonadaceae bacterium]